MVYASPSGDGKVHGLLLVRPEVELPDDLRFNEYGNVMSGETDA